MGRSGAAAARLLAGEGYSVVGFDSSKISTGTEHMSRTVFGDYTTADLKNLSLLVLSPGVPVSAPISSRASELGVPVIGGFPNISFPGYLADMLIGPGNDALVFNHFDYFFLLQLLLHCRWQLQLWKNCNL